MITLSRMAKSANINWNEYLSVYKGWGSTIFTKTQEDWYTSQWWKAVCHDVQTKGKQTFKIFDTALLYLPNEFERGVWNGLRVCMCVVNIVNATCIDQSWLKLGQDDHWMYPHTPCDFDLCLTFDLDIGVNAKFGRYVFFASWKSDFYWLNKPIGINFLFFWFLKTRKKDSSHAEMTRNMLKHQ